ncbi:MAG: hypothetical protein K2F59_02605, partial [Eubacteriales bacterium]|nr:hypothetical protein [Eubacteriales bacterium]
MYQKLKNLFTKNLPWKILSILVSCLLWFVAMNINNPTEIKNFSIPLDLSNLKEETSKKNMVVLNIEELEEIKVEIKLKATRPVLDELTKRFSDSNIKASLDITSLTNLSDTALSEITDPFEIPAQIKTNLNTVPYPNNNFEILSISPTSLNINID